MIIIFDLDDVLVKINKTITDEMANYIINLSKNHTLGIVAEHTIKDIKKQLKNVFDKFKYIFAECGSVVYIDDELILKRNVENYDTKLLNDLIKISLFEISLLQITHSGNMIQFRNGTVHIIPYGMQASKKNKRQFKKYDDEYNSISFIISKLKQIDVNDKFYISKGNDYDIYIYPKKWNKSSIMNYFPNDIHFIYAHNDEMGNNYPLLLHERVIGHINDNNIEKIIENLK